MAGGSTQRPLYIRVISKEHTVHGWHRFLRTIYGFNGILCSGAAAMKRIDAVIRQQFLDEVKEKLMDAGIEGMTATEVMGFGRQKGHTESYRGHEYRVDFHRKYLLTIIVRDEQVEPAIDAIITGARTGQFGDGKIFLSALEEVVRIRTGEIGVAAS